MSKSLDIFGHYSSLLKLQIFDVPVLGSLVVPVVPCGFVDSGALGRGVSQFGTFKWIYVL